MRSRPGTRRAALKGLVADLTLDKQSCGRASQNNSRAGGQARLGAVGGPSVRRVGATRIPRDHRAPLDDWATRRDDVEFATLEWVWWFNHRRLLEPLGYLPPAEFEEQFLESQHTQVSETALT